MTSTCTKLFPTLLISLLLALTPLVRTEAITLNKTASASETELLIAGQVMDTNGALLPDATLQLLAGGELLSGFTADTNGAFEQRLRVEQDTGAITLRISFVGYTPLELALLPEDGPEYTDLDIRLRESALQQQEVLLTASPAGSNRSYRATDAVSLNQLQERAADNFGAALAMQPGVSVRSFGAAASRPVIRGFDGQRVLVLENGERMGDLAETAPDHATAMDPDVAERIEIIRGPASFLYGSGAMGGVVNVLNGDVPANWQPGLSGRLSATGTSVNEGGSGFGRITYGGTQTAVSGRLNYRDAGDVHTPDGPLSGTQNRNLNAALGLGFQNDGFRGGLSASFLEQDYGLPEAPDEPLEDIEIRLDRQHMGGFGRFESAGLFDQAQLRFNLSRYKHQEIEILREEAAAPPEEALGIEFRTTTLSGSLLMIREDRRDGRRSGALGSSMMVRSLGLGGEEGLTPDGRNLNTAVFGYLEQPVTAALSVQTGLRLDYNRMETYANQRFDQPDNPNRNDFALSGSAGLNYRPGLHLESGLQLARSFRTPTIEELFTDAAHLGAGAYEIGDSGLDNEIGYGLDAFTRYGRGMIDAEISAFYYLIQNFIVYQPSGEIHEPSGLPVSVVEGDNARYYGFEADVMLRPLRSLSASAGMDMVRAERLDGGGNLPFIPPLKLRNSLRYEQRSWHAGLELLHAFEQSRTAPNEKATDAYTLVNLSAGLRLDAGGRHLLDARIDNLFNERYRDHLSRVENRAVRNPMPGRGITLRYQYLF